MNPPPTSLPITSLWVIPMHQPQACCILRQITCFSGSMRYHAWVAQKFVWLSVVVQSLGHFWLFLNLWSAACQASLSFTISPVGSTQVLWVSDAIQPSHPLSSPSLMPSVFPSIRVFPYESALCIRWPKYWSFSFGISPSNEYSRLISFRIDWFDLAVQGTLRANQ